MGILSEETKIEAKKMFKAADTDKSGYIEKSELKAVLTAMAKSEGLDEPSDAMVEHRLKSADTSGDGKISFREYYKFMKGMKVMMIVAEVFSKFDTDNSGTIDKRELKNVLKMLCKQQGLATLRNEEISKFMTAIDKSGDGVIDFYEFTDFMSPQIMAKYGDD